MSHLVPKDWPFCRAALGSRQGCSEVSRNVLNMSILHVSNKKWEATRGDVFSYWLFPSRLCNISVIWEDNSLASSTWSVWANARLLHCTALRQFGTITDPLSGFGAWCWVPFLQLRNGSLTSALNLRARCEPSSTPLPVSSFSASCF